MTKRSNESGTAKARIIYIVLILFVLSIVYADNTIEPSAPTSFEYRGNYSGARANGSQIVNKTRASIHTIKLDAQQTSLKWIGYAGNISGQIVLQGSGDESLFRWDLVTVGGEIYATKEGPKNGALSDGIEGGGIPEWENLVCANLENLTFETKLMNHSIAYGSYGDQDQLLSTFIQQGAGWTASKDFYVGQNAFVINGKDQDGSDCYGLHLNINETNQSALWQEVIMMDLTYEEEVAIEGTNLQWDLVYVTTLENKSDSFINGSVFDWQMILPQSGVEFPTSNIPFYFYIELQ
ncbi:hypothetical protein GOV09_00655 [Candidatus Woesearchaeota archaeon]|nr:hypothetical protein [Candidatus Woesearchaeota archaeon]